MSKVETRKNRATAHFAAALSFKKLFYMNLMRASTSSSVVAQSVANLITV
jgi:hypothetical protein